MKGRRKKTVFAECSSCGGTGLYCGFMEPKGTAAHCLSCDGTGCETIEYVPFKKKKRKNGIKSVFISGGKLFILN